MPITASHTDHNLTDACHTVAGEIARTDGKASLLLAFNGAVLAGLTTLPRAGLPPLTQACEALAIATLGAAAVLSGIAVHKYVLLRRAVDLSLMALALLAVVGITAL